MRCVDCEQHDCVCGTHFCNYKGKSGRRKPRRIGEEDAHKDMPCEFVEGVKEQPMTNKEAIEALKRIRDEAMNEFIGEWDDYEAFSVAIKALKGADDERQ